MELEKFAEFQLPEEEDVNNFEMKVDKVYKMLEDLTCTDEKTVKDAEEKIDKFLAETKAEEAKEFVQVRTGVDKTSINKDKIEEIVKKANEYKEMGNEAFKQGQYKKAEELYTSALMIKDDNHMIYTNR